MKTRTWLRNVTNSTLVIPARPPAAIKLVANRRPLLFSLNGQIAKGRGDRRLLIDLRIRNHACNHRRDRDIQHGAQAERSQNGKRHVALRILGFFRVRRNRVEADVGKEDQRRPQHHAGKAVGHERAADRFVDRNSRWFRPSTPSMPHFSAANSGAFSRTSCSTSADVGLVGRGLRQVGGVSLIGVRQAFFGVRRGVISPAATRRSPSCLTQSIL